MLSARTASARGSLHRSRTPGHVASRSFRISSTSRALNFRHSAKPTTRRFPPATRPSVRFAPSPVTPMGKETRRSKGKARSSAPSHSRETTRHFKRIFNSNEPRVSVAGELCKGHRVPRAASGEGKAYGNLGNAYKSQGDFSKAIKYHGQRLAIAKEVGDRAGEGRAYANLGVAYQSQGDFSKAIAYHTQRLAIAKEVGDRAGDRRKGTSASRIIRRGTLTRRSSTTRRTWRLQRWWATGQGRARYTETSAVATCT